MGGRVILKIALAAMATLLSAAAVLADPQERDMSKAAETTEILRARLHAEQAEHALARGEAATALALALEAAAVEPRAVEPERALNRALAALNERNVLSGHQYRVAAALFSPDGAVVYTGDHGGDVRRWNAETGALTARFETKIRQLASLSLSQDGARLAAAPGYGGDAALLDAATGEEIAPLPSDGATMNLALFSPDGSRLLTEGYARPIQIWDGVSGAALGAFTKHAQNAHKKAVVFSPDGRQVASGDSAGVVWIWEVDDPETARRLDAHERDVRQLSFSPDGARLLSLGWDERMRLWDVASGAALREWRGDFGSAVFSPDGERILTARLEATRDAAGIWDARTGALLNRFVEPGQAFGEALFSPDGRRVAARSWEGAAFVWDVATERRLGVFGHGLDDEESLRAIAFSPDGAKLLTSGDYGVERVAPAPATARIWDVETRAAPARRLRLAQPNERFSRPNGFALSADGAYAAAWSRYDASAWLWALDTGEARRLKGHQDNLRSLAFSPDGAQALTSSRDGEIRLWDLKTAATATSWRAETGGARFALFSPEGAPIAVEIADYSAFVVTDLAADTVLAQEEGVLAEQELDLFALAPDGRHLIGSSRDGSRSAIFDLETRTLITDDASGRIDALLGRALSGDGRRLLTAVDGRVIVTDVANGQTLAESGWFSPHSSFGSVSFSPDGARIAAAGPDEAVWIRDGETGATLQILRDLGPVSTAYFSPDGALLAVTPRRGPIRLLARDPFGPERWREIAALGDGARGAAFTPDGRRVFAWTGDALEIWSTPERGEALIAKARRAAPRCLSVDQRRRYALDPDPPRWCVTGAGLEDETDPKQWRPLHPYRDRDWVRWLAQKDKGEAAAAPTKPTDR